MNGAPIFPRKEVCNSIGNSKLFAYFVFENIEFILGQGVVQTEPN